MMTRTEDHRQREQLALAFRLCERFGFHEGICNHLSVSLGPSPAGDVAERYLINPYGIHWSMMQPEDLLMIDGDGRVLAGSGDVESTARHIHIAAHRANPRHIAVFHTHMPYATALTMLEGEAGELAMAHQTACRFHGRMAYEREFGGLAQDGAEGERLSRQAADRREVDVVFLANHGVVVSGSSVALAFDDLYYLERACRQQVLAMQTGASLKRLSSDVVDNTAGQIMRDLESVADKHFEALGNVLKAAPDRALTF